MKRTCITSYISLQASFKSASFLVKVRWMTRRLPLPKPVQDNVQLFLSGGDAHIEKRLEARALRSDFSLTFNLTLRIMAMLSSP